MSEAIQTFLMGCNPGAVPHGIRPGDAGTEGFAQLFEQQMLSVPGSRAKARPPEPMPVRKAGGKAEAPRSSEGPSGPAVTVAGAQVDALKPTEQAGAPVPAEATAPQPGPVAAPVEAPVPEPPAAPAPQAVLNPAAEALAPAAVAEPVPGVPVPGVQDVPKGPVRAWTEKEAPETNPKASPQAAVAHEEAPGLAKRVEAAAVVPEEVLDEAFQGRPAPASRPLPVLPQAASPVAAAVQEALAVLEPGAPAPASLVPGTNPVALAAVAAAQAPAVAVPASGSAEAPASPVQPGAAGPAASEGGAAKAASTPRATQAEMIERLAATAKMLSTARGEKVFLLRLTPPQLGHIRVALTVQDGVLNASLQTESHAARQSILQSLDHLKAALADQGLQLGRFDVTVEGEAGAPQFQAGQGGSGRRRRSEEEAEAEALLAGAVPGLRRSEDEQDSGSEPVFSDAMAVDLMA